MHQHVAVVAQPRAAKKHVLMQKQQDQHSADEQIAVVLQLSALAKTASRAAVLLAQCQQLASLLRLPCQTVAMESTCEREQSRCQRAA